jgi:hypothetical protein
LAIVTEIPWDAVAWPDFGADRAAWREAVTQIATKAREKLPACNGRVEKAVALVLAGDVAYKVERGTCSCKDYPRAPHNFCKHRV